MIYIFIYLDIYLVMYIFFIHDKKIRKYIVENMFDI